MEEYHRELEEELKRDEEEIERLQREG